MASRHVEIDGKRLDVFLVDGSRSKLWGAGVTYEGPVDRDYLPSGYGTWDTSEGRYVGHFVAGRFDGKGTFYYNDGTTFVGNWSEGRPLGPKAGA